MAKASPGVLKLPGRFQFLGIPPKGEPYRDRFNRLIAEGSFQFLGIPPKGELEGAEVEYEDDTRFQFLGIPPKGEQQAHDNLRPL